MAHLKVLFNHHSFDILVFQWRLVTLNIHLEQELHLSTTAQLHLSTTAQ
uniref:Uncharacterized protein n=1 Tax=Arundo donax TaxID=35708 RepID=A0A0A9A810_ARUDO